MAVGRRGVMTGSVATGLAARPIWPAAAATHPGFLWGTATAAHQIEGNNVNSDYWVLETVPSTGFKEPSGDACDSWERWREDIALLTSIGATAYRFSIEWARIEPEPGRFSNAVLEHYRRQCGALRDAGIAPVVTFHHFTSPRWIAAAGGWENPGIVDRFARYCERAARALGDLPDYGCTLNEPNAQVTSYVMRDGTPHPNEAPVRAEAQRAVGSDRFGAFFMGNAFTVRDTILAGHAKAAAAIKSASPSIKLGLTLALQDMRPGPGGDARYARVFAEARAPFYAAASADDFIGVQPYTRLTVGPDGYLPPAEGTLRDRGSNDASPDVLGAVVREVHAHCKAPIMITENGIDTVDDHVRETHLIQSVDDLRECVDDGIPVLGYFYWSLLDNFEWSSGYVPRFGLYGVDRTTFARTPKPAAATFRSVVAKARGL